jgi:hypothetical protein
MGSRSRLGLLLLSFLSVLPAACSDDSGDGAATPAPPDDNPPPPFNGVDMTVACPPGQIGWDFSTGGGRVDAGATTGKTCIPTICSGKTQRDAFMKCVATPDIPEVSLPAASMSTGRFWMEPSSSDYKQSWIQRTDTATTRPDYRDTVEIYPGVWGDWQTVAMCKPGYWINGYRVRVEGSQGGGDDTALNAVEFSCLNQQGGAHTISSHPGIWGDWKQWNYCPVGKFAVGSNLRFEDPDGDDTAGNDVALYCNDGSTLLGPGGAGWGAWKPVVKCGANRVACGAQVRFEGSQGGGDDTAMNGLRMACCDAPGTGANASNGARPLYQEVPYKFTATLNTEGSAFKARSAVWVTRKMIDARTVGGAVVTNPLPPREAFVCTLTYLDAEKLKAGAAAVLSKSRDIGELISPECVQGFRDATTNYNNLIKVQYDAAIAKAGTTRTAIDAANAAYTTAKAYVADSVVIMHVSFDPMGDTYVPPTTAANTIFRFSTGGAAPNPPGFFYYPTLKWVDMIGFYQQREIVVPWVGPNGETTGLQSSLLHEAAASAFDMPTKLLIGIKDFALESSTITFNPYEPSPPSMTVDVDWQNYGDVEANPYSSKKGAVVVSGISNMNARNLRATVEFRPSDTALGWKSLGSFKLPSDAAVATGSVKSGTFLTSKENVRDIFRPSAGAWKTATMFDIRVCLDADGLSPRQEAGLILRLPSVQAGNYLFTAGYESADKGCVVKAKNLVVARDTLYRPLPPQRSDANVGMGDTTKSGGEDASGSTDNGGEKLCQTTTTGRRCDSNSSSSMGGKGFFGRSFYGTDSVSSKDENKDGSGRTSTKSDAEVVGFQVIDMDDSEQSQGWADEATTPKNGFTLTIAPNWDIIIEGLELLNPPGPPPKPKFEKKVVKGRSGLGVGIGFEASVQIGPIPGRLIATFGIGVSIALVVKLTFTPETPYPCTGDSNSKCFMASTDRKNQSDASRACSNRGARLAEIRGARDRDGIMAAAGGDNHYWIGGQLAYQYNDLNCADPVAAKLDPEVCKRDSQTSYRWLGSDREIARSVGTSATVDYLGYAQIPARPPGGIQLATAVPVAAGLAYHGAYQRIVAIPQSTALPYVCEYDGVGKTRYSDISLGVEVAVGVGLTIGFYIPNEHFGFGIEGTVDFITVSLTPTVGYREFTLLDNSGGWLGTRGSVYTIGPWEVNLLSCGVSAVANFVLFSARWSLLSYPGFNVAGGKLWDVSWPTMQVSALRPEPAVEAVRPDVAVPADKKITVIEGEIYGTEHAIGQAVGDGWEAKTGRDAAGYMLTGPARSDVPAGAQMAQFRLMVDNNAGNDQVARIEVVDTTSNVALAQRDLYRSDFPAANTYADFILMYTATAGRAVAFRVYWTAKSTVNLDRVTTKARRADLRGEVVVATGSWGDWQGMRYCPEESFITGYHMRVEDSQGSGDDTALNSVEFQCSDRKGAKSNLLAHPGQWGSWRDWASCPSGGYIKGGEMKIEGGQGSGDDTAGNSVRVQCTTSTTALEAPGGAPWGGWQAVANCPTGQVACGAEVRIEGSQGGGDDTAMNGLKFVCCDPARRSTSTATLDIAVDGSGGGMWAGAGNETATCGQGASLIGISKPTNDQDAHRALCGNFPGLAGSAQTAVLSLPNDQRRLQRNGDWAPNLNKLECGANEFVSGVSQGTAAGAGISAVRCSSGGGSSNGCEYRTLINGTGFSNAYPEWDGGFYKTDCPTNKTVVGVAVVPGTAKVSGVLCCEM